MEHFKLETVPVIKMPKKNCKVSIIRPLLQSIKVGESFSIPKSFKATVGTEAKTKHPHLVLSILKMNEDNFRVVCKENKKN